MMWKFVSPPGFLEPDWKGIHNADFFRRKRF